MAPSRSKLLSMILAAALVLATAAPMVADGKENGNGNGNGKGSENGNGKGKGGGKQKTPSRAVQGDYVIRIAGYYTGNGTGTATGDAVSISATVRDPTGKVCIFQSTQLDVADDRFSGTGTLDGAVAQIVGRLDGKDAKGNNGVQGKEVLKKGRMTFTFSVNGRHARGAGAKGEAAGG